MYICTSTDIGTYSDSVCQHGYVLICKLQNTFKRGYPGPPLERVFNRMGCLTQSLYARARIGIVCRVQNTPFGPLRYPDLLVG